MLHPLLPTGFEKMMIQGMVGPLEVCVFVPVQLTEQTPLLLIAHPHPLHGGSFYNKVVQTIAKAGAELMQLVVCFNFRGVGASAGEFDHGHGERYDLKAVYEFAMSQWGARKVFLAGFSFGAWMASLMVETIQPNRLLLVAPPVSLYPMERLDLSTVSVTVIQGARDEVVASEQVILWATQQGSDLLWRASASHYFHGQLLWLKQSVLMTLRDV